MLMFGGVINSQRLESSFGAGYGVLRISSSESLCDQSGGLLPSWSTGLHATFPETDRISLEAAIEIIRRGTTISTNSDLMGTLKAERLTISLYYLRMPLMIKKDLTYGENRWFAVCGTYLGLGLGGKLSTRTEIPEFEDVQRVRERIKWGFNIHEDHFVWYDYGLTVGFGKSFSMVRFKILYDLGMTNIAAYNIGTADLRNRSVSIVALVQIR
jgi:hypothetical protein